MSGKIPPEESAVSAEVLHDKTVVILQHQQKDGAWFTMEVELPDPGTATFRGQTRVPDQPMYDLLFPGEAVVVHEMERDQRGRLNAACSVVENLDGTCVIYPYTQKTSEGLHQDLEARGVVLREPLD